jgi:hypothetical protein
MLLRGKAMPTIHWKIAHQNHSNDFERGTSNRRKEPQSLHKEQQNCVDWLDGFKSDREYLQGSPTTHLQDKFQTH